LIYILADRFEVLNEVKLNEANTHKRTVPCVTARRRRRVNASVPASALVHLRCLVCMILATSLEMPWLYRRRLNLKAKLETTSSLLSFKRLISGAFNMGFIG
jgi:hypothetical protein